MTFPLRCAGKARPCSRPSQKTFSVCPASKSSRCGNDDGRFRTLAGQCDWTLVIAPEFDDLLLGRSQTVLDIGGRLLGSLPGAIRLTSDKLATARYWHERGVRHPRTDLGGAPAPRVHSDLRSKSFVPFVLKPRHGAGSQATFLIRDMSEYPAILQAAHEEYPGEFIVQPYVAGQAASVALLIGPMQTVPLLSARQHLSSDGRFRYEGGALPLPEPWASRAVALALQAVACIPGLQGYVGVDLVLGETGDHAIEINPRLTTSYIGLRRLCGQNLADLMLRCVRGEPIEPITWAEASVEFRVAEL